MEKLTVCVPFSGFYESIHDEAMDRMIFDEEMTEEEWKKRNDEVDWQEERIRYCRLYVKSMSKVLGFKLEFEEMTSPREYNFETDRIFAKIDRKDFEKMKAEINEIKMEEYVKEHFTSRDGFSSFYSNCWDDWLDQEEPFDHNQIGALLSCWLATEHGGKGWDGWEGEVYEGIEYYY